MNKKMINVCIAIIILLVIAIAFVIFNFGRKEEIPDVEETSLSEKVIIKSKKTQSESSTKVINVTIPEVQSLDSDYANYINLKMYNELSEAKVYENAIEGYASEDIGVFTYEASYERYNCEDYVSLVATQYIHLGDGRPRTQKKCYVIDSANSNSPTLVDVFKEKNSFERAILEEINRQAQEDNIELVGGNGLKELDDEQAFYIKDGKLVLYFEASEIAATAVGELEFVMPFKMVDGKFSVLE